jgi:hypothetical protein
MNNIIRLKFKENTGLATSYHIPYSLVIYVTMSLKITTNTTMTKTYILQSTDLLTIAFAEKHKLLTSQCCRFVETVNKSVEKKTRR